MLYDIPYVNVLEVIFGQRVRIHIKIPDQVWARGFCLIYIQVSFTWTTTAAKIQ